jgi:putative effector of murein hydrolase
MDTALSHLLHSVIITVILYIIMKFFLNQSETMSLNRSILIGALALIYMILFGHGLPTHLNKI